MLYVLNITSSSLSILAHFTNNERVKSHVIRVNTLAVEIAVGASIHSFFAGDIRGGLSNVFTAISAASSLVSSYVSLSSKKLYFKVEYK